MLPCVQSIQDITIVMRLRGTDIYDTDVRVAKDAFIVGVCPHALDELLVIARNGTHKLLGFFDRA